MKSYELKPTCENVYKTFISNSIGRNNDIFHFVELLNSIDESCSIAINGLWGSGKTFFINQIKMVLDAYNEFTCKNDNDDKIIKCFENICRKEFEIKQHVTVYYDAWSNDNDDDPIYSIIYSIMQSSKTLSNIEQESSIIEKGIAIFELFIGKNINDTIKSLRNKKYLSEIEEQKSIHDLINEFFDSLLPEKGERLVIFIDELDRCKPSYAVKLLERVKHYFSNSRITFVFSINVDELQHTIKQFYGYDFNGYKYLDRFFDLRMNLSNIDRNLYYKFIKFELGFWENDTIADRVIEKYNLQMREIEKYVRLIKISSYKITHSDVNIRNKCLEMLLVYIIPIMIGLKISDSVRYNNFVDGKDYTPLLEILSDKEFLLSTLLNHGESYNISDDNKKYITVNDKIKELYDAIFNFNTEYSITVGRYSFERYIKKQIIGIENLLSDYADYNMEYI